MTAQTIDYGDSRVRTALTWLVYPVCVLLPFTWLVSNLNVDEPLKLHRWHHSSMIRHSKSNLIIFDVLFGTRCLPSEPQNIKQMGLGEHDAFFPQTWWQ